MASSVAGPSRLAPRIARLPQRSVLEVSGPDAKKFLNGQSCKNVEALEGGYSGFLNASGRVQHNCFIIPRSANSYLISHESPAEHPAPLQTLLPPFKLRSKVRIKDVSAEWETWATWGGEVGGTGPVPTRVWRPGSSGANESQWSWPDGVRDLGIAEEEVGCWDLRAGLGMRQLLVPTGQRPSLATSHDEASPEDYQLHRMLLGLPEGPAEVVPGHALPLESSMDIHGGVDFRKGCYLGQELTVRTYHTGATRKRILPIRLFPLGNPSAELSTYIGADGPGPEGPAGLQVGKGVDITYHPPASSATQRTKSAGKILSLHPTHSSVGLGLVRLEFAERSWWSTPLRSGATVQDWQDNEGGRLSASVGGADWGVFVGQGEAYSAALVDAEKREKQ